MPEFNPSPRQRITIGGQGYEVMPHPAVPTFAFGQEGRKAYVFQIKGGPTGGLYALKKFKEAFRVPGLVGVNEDLAQFAQWEGLEVCERTCLHKGEHDDILSKHPDLEYAVLMPWITGTTWYDVVIGSRALTKAESLAYANAMAQVLAGLEEASLAHCDISAANVIINPITERAHLIDVEDIYAPNFKMPEGLPAGTDGYAHRTASSGLWRPEADRFAGAIIICEMATWFNPEIRKAADEEHYFAQEEMQTGETPRYTLMRQTLVALDPRLGDLLDQVWRSKTLKDCPRLNAWQDIFEDLYRQVKIAEVVGSWRPITMPGAEPAAAPVMAPISAPAPDEVPDEAAAPVNEAPEESPAPAPLPPAPAPIPPAAAPARPAPAPIATPSRPPVIANTPVVAWTPLTVPQALAPERIPLTMPDPEPERQPIQPAVEEAPAEEAPEPMRAAQEFTPLAMTIPSPEEEAPTEETWAEEEAEPAAWDDEAEAAPEEEIPAEEAEPIYEAPDMDEAAVLAPPEEEDPFGSSTMLLKPQLDLSHIDIRSRPFIVWTASQEAESYRVQEARNADFTSGVKEFEVKGEDTHWNPAWGRTGRMYYRVRAEAGEDAGPWSEVLALRFGE